MKKSVNNKDFIPKFSEEALNRTIKNCKSIFIENEAKKTISNKEFLMIQAKFIDKKLWILQSLLMVFLVYVLIKNTGNLHFESSTYFSIITPLLVILSIPELLKSIRYGTFEIENCAYFSTKKVYLAKLIIIGMSDLIFFTIITCVAYKTTKLPIYQIIIYYLVPFNSTCCICFTMLASFKKKSSDLVVLSIGILWTFIMYSLSKYMFIYKIFQTSIWIELIIISIIYMVFIFKKMILNMRNYFEIIEFSN